MAIRPDPHSPVPNAAFHQRRKDMSAQRLGKKLAQMCMEKEQPDLDAVRALIEQGAGLTIQSSPESWTPFIHALLRGHNDVADLLLAHGADVNGWCGKWTALMVAASMKKFDAVEFIVSRGADLDLLQDCGEWGKVTARDIAGTHDNRQAQARFDEAAARAQPALRAYLAKRALNAPRDSSSPAPRLKLPKP